MKCGVQPIIVKIVAVIALANTLSVLGRGAERPLSVCEVMARLESHANRVVRVIGEFGSGPEQFSLYETSCKTPFKTRGYSWPPAFNLVSPGNLGAPSALPFVPDVSSIQAFHEAVRKVGSLGVVGCLIVTGMVQVRGDYYDGAQSSGNRGRGFGHMGALPAQLILKSVEVQKLRPFERGSTPGPVCMCCVGDDAKAKAQD